MRRVVVRQRVWLRGDRRDREKANSALGYYLGGSQVADLLVSEVVYGHAAVVAVLLCDMQLLVTASASVRVAVVPNRGGPIPIL